MTRFCTLAAAVAFAAASPSLGPAQALTGSRVMAAAEVHARERMRNVQNYTLRLEVLSAPVVVYAARNTSGTFDVSFGKLGPSLPLADFVAGFAAGADAIPLGMLEADGSGDSLTYEGRVMATGAPAYSVRVGRAQAAGPAADADGANAESVRLQLDTATYVVRHLDFAFADDGRTMASVSIDYSDWRDAGGGALIPFRRHLELKGVRSTLLGTHSEEEVRARLGVWKDSLATMEEPRRSQTAALVRLIEQVLATGGFTLDVAISSATLNQGPPAGVTLERVDF
jgi:hypothetical protein